MKSEQLLTLAKLDAEENENTNKTWTVARIKKIPGISFPIVFLSAAMAALTSFLVKP